MFGTLLSLAFVWLTLAFVWLTGFLTGSLRERRRIILRATNALVAETIKFPNAMRKSIAILEGGNIMGMASIHGTIMGFLAATRAAFSVAPEVQPSAMSVVKSVFTKLPKKDERNPPDPFEIEQVMKAAGETMSTHGAKINELIRRANDRGFE